MKLVEFEKTKNLEPFINGILVMESSEPNEHTKIPLYADGYPGIMFQQSENGLFFMPKNKKLSELFLYGQTLTPVALEVKGSFEFVVVQLYPFASKYLLGVDPKELNDDCFDLLQLKHIDIEGFRRNLVSSKNLDERIKIISELMQQLIESNRVEPDDRIQQAIKLILDNDGKVTIKNLLDQLYVTERTFERNFVSQVGLSPKQFARIIQFQCSLQHLTKSKYEKLLEIGHDSGFSDQSHFIRAFKQYTGQTPSYYLKQSASV